MVRCRPTCLFGAPEAAVKDAKRPTPEGLRAAGGALSCWWVGGVFGEAGSHGVCASWRLFVTLTAHCGTPLAD